MTGIRDGYLAAAATAVGLLEQAEVARRWEQASALPQMSVGALACHLGRQLFNVSELLAGGPGDQAPISVLEHYARADWVGAGLDDEPNVFVRDASAAQAAAGPAALVAGARDAFAQLTTVLPAEPPERVVLVVWGPWSLRLDDFLVTRMMEIAVHGDDLASSVGLPTPELPPDVADSVVVLLARLAARRHGAPALIRAFSRAERAPASVAAF